jgi:hypothetical protein
MEYNSIRTRSAVLQRRSDVYPSSKICQQRSRSVIFEAIFKLYINSEWQSSLPDISHKFDIQRELGVACTGPGNGLSKFGAGSISGRASP